MNNSVKNRCNVDICKCFYNPKKDVKLCKQNYKNNLYDKNEQNLIWKTSKL